MLIRVVRMTFKPEGVAGFLTNFHANKDSIRNFPGCQHLELWQDENDATIFLTHSHWKSEEHLNQYRDSELFKTVWTYTKRLFADRPVAFSSKKIEEVRK
ncbi:putative quinol monooxygenase [Algoriphagus yeomjeoni]|uniref:Quinol monooxygenase YgiN n=1 Tax=Algoriphagus yeomjeoni TaxID=291403 RepID=A0A327PIG5_9BACT|nr:antibiotic biosynthesis monooxygenase family protein [Algoriphagus yeomjeoni]RAI91958.1 quinol monooxygenase YgiN [Algoriphagus yeomjeoni]